MIQRMVLGVIGGALIALSVFMVGNSVEFSRGAPDSGATWVVFGAGGVVALFALLGVRTLIAFGAGAAAAVEATRIVDAARSGDFAVSARLVVLGVGVLAALAATIGRRTRKFVIESDAAGLAPVAVSPDTHVEVVNSAPATESSVAAARDEARRDEAKRDEDRLEMARRDAAIREDAKRDDMRRTGSTTGNSIPVNAGA